MTDWDDYAEAVAALARIPALESERRRVSAAEERAAVTAARSDLDAELRRCDDWAADARRALTNAEAKLVAAHVLIPARGASGAVAGSPAELAVDLRECDDELRAALAGLASDQRTSAREQAAAAARAVEQAARRRQLAKVAALAFVVLVLLVLGYLTAR